VPDIIYGELHRGVGVVLILLGIIMYIREKLLIIIFVIVKENEENVTCTGTTYSSKMEVGILLTGCVSIKTHDSEQIPSPNHLRH
jgi:hypothetical protein